jgi:hypothetical protein
MCPLRDWLARFVTFSVVVLPLVASAAPGDLLWEVHGDSSTEVITHGPRVFAAGSHQAERPGRSSTSYAPTTRGPALFCGSIDHPTSTTAGRYISRPTEPWSSRPATGRGSRLTTSTLELSSGRTTPAAS